MIGRFLCVESRVQQWGFWDLLNHMKTSWPLSKLVLSAQMKQAWRQVATISILAEAIFLLVKQRCKNGAVRILQNNYIHDSAVTSLLARTYRVCTCTCTHAIHTSARLCRSYSDASYVGTRQQLKATEHYKLYTYVATSVGWSGLAGPVRPVSPHLYFNIRPCVHSCCITSALSFTAMQCDAKIDLESFLRCNPCIWLETIGWELNIFAGHKNSITQCQV